MGLKRRHLKDGQKAMIAVDSKPLFAKEAKDRQKRKPKSVPVKMPEQKGDARDKAGEAFGVSGKYIDEAEEIKKKAPKEAKEVRAGKKTISQVKRSIKKAEVKKKVTELPSDKYRVIYANPPWKYGSTHESVDEKYARRWTAAELK